MAAPHAPMPSGKRHGRHGSPDDIDEERDGATRRILLSLQDLDVVKKISRLQSRCLEDHDDLLRLSSAEN